MVYPEGTFLWRGLLITSFKTIAYVVDKQSDVCRRYLLLQGLCVPSVKTTTYVCNRFNTSLCAREHKTNQAISNLNRKFWNKSMKFAPTRLIVWKTIPSFEFLHLVCTTSSTDLRFNKKFEQEKVYTKVFPNQYTLILLIYYF